MDNKEAKTGQKQTGKKPGFLRRLSTLFLILVVVLTAAVLSTMEDGSHFATLRRWLMYGDGAQTQNLYTYAPHEGNRCEPLGQDLLMVSPNAIQLLQRGGTLLFEIPISMNAPVISIGTDIAAVCDAGGNTVCVLNQSGLLWTHTVPDELLCYSARVSRDDIVTITEQTSGYKASVSTYDSRGNLTFRFDSHDSYICDATVSDDGKWLTAISLDAQNGVFTSNLILFDLATAERLGSYPLRDGLVMDLSITGNNIITLCDKRLMITTSDGEPVLNFAYGERYLHDYALTGKDFCALLLGRYQSSNICQLATFGLDGEALATLELTEEVLDLDAAGEYLAVLYSDTLVIYDKTLTETARLDGTDYAGHIRMSSDGTALLVAETSAWRFLP